MPERCLVEVPATLSDDRAVFAEPLAAALHVLRESEAAQPKRAVVLGDGKLGQLIVRALASQGVNTVLVGSAWSDRAAVTCRTPSTSSRRVRSTLCRSSRRAIRLPAPARNSHTRDAGER